MKKTLNYRYALKRVLPIAAFVGAGLMAGCEPEPQKPEPTVAAPIDPVKVLPFGDFMGIDSISYENVMKYANNQHITKIIYFNDSTNNNYNYTGYSTSSILKMRSILQERLDYTPKATGDGKMIFRHGSLTVEDSLWFVANGWKIKTR